METNIPNKTEKSDAELVEDSKRDPEAYRHLMERYEEALGRFLKRTFQFSREDIEDTLQEAFLKIYRNLNDYDPELKFSSWAYRITRNAAIDHSRRLKSRPVQVELEKNDYVKLIRSDENIHLDLANQECVLRVKGAIEVLPEKYREALVLRFVEEKDYQEIMDILKKPKGTVATLIDRGRKMLRAGLEQAGKL